MAHIGDVAADLDTEVEVAKEIVSLVDTEPGDVFVCNHLLSEVTAERDPGIEDLFL
jgi:hypothetical protein